MASGRKNQSQAKAEKERLDSAKSGVNALLKMVREPKVVTVNGVELTPMRPSKEAQLAYQKARLNIASKHPNGKDLSLEQFVEVQYDLAVLAVMGCFPFLDKTDAEDIMLASGGNSGELAEVCLGFYGVDERTAEALEKGELDLSFLSQEPSDEA